jgi:hypothetical protein
VSDGKSYRILETVASGGTAVPYRAPDLARQSGRGEAPARPSHQDEHLTRRFVPEAKRQRRSIIRTSRA